MPSSRKPFPTHIVVFLAPAVIIYTVFMIYPLLDSLRLMELIPLLEQQFSIRVAVEDLTPDNFDSLTSISRYVMERRA